MQKLKTGVCVKCKEIRILFENNKCIFCEKGKTERGVKVKQTGNSNAYGIEVESNTGTIKAGLTDNSWMNENVSPKRNI